MLDKTNFVSNVFAKVADKYDFMNDIMSLGIHRIWKQSFVNQLNIAKDATVLDMAAGTCDISILLAKEFKLSRLYCVDLQAKMLQKGQEAMLDNGCLHAKYLVANAEKIPLPSSCIDAITLSFGLRNFADIAKGLNELYRILKPGGSLNVLEFSKPNGVVAPFYDVILENIIPKIGKYVANDETSYAYLAKSIKAHPNQEQLQQLMYNSGFSFVSYTNYSKGIAAVHTAIK